MVRTIGYGLPSLAHPIYSFEDTEPSKGHKAEHRAFVPGFPEIPVSEFAGVCLPHICSVGLNESADLASLVTSGHHELAHWRLAGATLPSLLRKVALYLMLDIRKSINEGMPYKKIRVPLRGRCGNSRLEDEWNALTSLHELTSAVSEVLAVWYSCERTEACGLFSRRERTLLEKQYRELYGRWMAEFPQLYDSLKRIATRGGPEVAVWLAHWALMQPSPDSFFLESITRVEHDLRAGRSLDLSKSPIEVNVKYASYYEIRDRYPLQYLVGEAAVNDALEIEALLDKETPTLQRGKLWCRAEQLRRLLTEKREALFERSQWILNLAVDIEQPAIWPFVFTFGREGIRIIPQSYVRCMFEKMVGPLPSDSDQAPDPPISSEALHFMFFLESLRQQLTQGIGLECPYWNPVRARCAISSPVACDLRGMLQRLWDRTEPLRTARQWVRNGCP